MNTAYALLLISGLVAALVSLTALGSRRRRPLAIKVLAVSGGVFLFALLMFKPDPPAAPQAAVEEAAIPSTAPREPATPPPPPPPSVAQTNTDSAAVGSPGTARICLQDDELHLPTKAVVTIPATTVLEDDGPLTGQRNDPTSWGYEVKEGFKRPAAIITLAAAVLKPPSRCADVQVKMFLDQSWTDPSQKSVDAHIFSMTDVVDYPIPDRKPPVEIGKLIDDIGVKAILLTDVTASTPSPRQTVGEDARAAACLEGAKALAAHLGGGIGKAGSLGVQLGGIAAHEASYGCSTGGKDAPDLFVSWDGQARPPTATKAVIGKGGAFLTGAPSAEIIGETTACIAAAMKPDADEQATREFRGVKIECTAFARDGSAGTVTVYRRFGAGPSHAGASAEALAAVDRASDAIRANDAKSAEQSLAFAKWWQDPAIPKEVKTFAMMSARLITLRERCPSAKPYQEKIAGWAASAGVEPADIEPGGRYHELMTSMISALRAGVQKDTIETACADVKRYD